MKMQNKKAGIVMNIIVILVVLGAILFIWGTIGASQAEKVGVTCDVELGDSLCLKWHTNLVGQVINEVEDAGDEIKKNLEDLKDEIR